MKEKNMTYEAEKKTGIISKTAKMGCAVIFAFIVLIIVIAIVSGSKPPTPEENARKIYEQLIMDNATTVIEKIPTYASEGKVCAYKDGFLIEDPYNAEWYVIGNKIFAVNGLAKSLTPNVEYAPKEISYQPCY